MSKLRSGAIFGVGNPLLDMKCHVSKEFLDKWKLKENDAILCDDEHVPMFMEMQNLYSVEYVAGGSTQNTLRMAQTIIGKPNVVTFMGSVGDDRYADKLEEDARRVGLNVIYQKQKNMKTGTCAVLCYADHRSLCAHLGAANFFNKTHFDKPEHRLLMENATIYYTAGFTLTVCPDVVLDIAEHSHAHAHKTFMFNLSAPFICHQFKDLLAKLLHYVDVVFCNDTEAVAFATSHNWNTTDVAEIGSKIAAFPKANPVQSRIVVLTQGPGPVIIVQNNTVTTYTPEVIPAEKIIDTNGAGDAFVGGFLAQYILGASTEQCVACGCQAAQIIIQSSN